MINLHHLHIFQMVATCGSFSRAAERLKISQPAVSMQLARLEESLGVALVQQRGRQILLTEAGKALDQYASRIFRLADEALSTMEDYRQHRRGRLRLMASSTPGAYILPSVMAAFQAEHPSAELSLQIANTQLALQAVNEGVSEFAIIGEAPSDLADIQLEPLCIDRLQVVVSPGHPWAQERSISAITLSCEPLILRERGSNTREVLDRRLTEQGLLPTVAMELGNTEAIKQAVAAGLGASVLSEWAVRWEIESRRLVSVEVTSMPFQRTLQLAVGAGRELSGLASHFVAHLRRYVGQADA